MSKSKSKAKSMESESVVCYLYSGCLKLGIVVLLEAKSETELKDKLETLRKTYGSTIKARYCKTTVTDAFVEFCNKMKDCREGDTTLYKSTDKHCMTILKQVCEAKKSSKWSASKNDADSDEETEKVVVQKPKIIKLIKQEQKVEEDLSDDDSEDEKPVETKKEESDEENLSEESDEKPKAKKPVKKAESAKKPVKPKAKKT